MPPTELDLSFFNARQIRELAEAALKSYERASELYYGSSNLEIERQAANMRWAAVKALSFCAEAIGLLREPSLWDLALRIPEQAGEFISELRGSWSFGTEGIKAFAARGLEPKQVEYCVGHHMPSVRYAIASALPTDGPGIETLRRLCEDDHHDVRSCAVERLRKVVEVRWWTGRFSFDPFEKMTAEEAQRHKPAVMALSEALNTYLVKEKLVEALEHAASIPAVVACDVVKRLVRAEAIDKYREASAPARAAAILAAAGELGARAVEELVDSASKVWELLEPYLDALSGDARPPVLQKLLSSLEANLNGDDSYDGIAYNLSAVLGRCWPAGADPAPLLELALARKADGVDSIAMHLGHALERTERLDSVKAQVMEQHLRGYEGIWKSLASSCRVALARLPDVELAEVAERAMASGNESAVAWAIAQRIRSAEQRRDGSAAALVLALDDDPTTRPLMRQCFIEYLIPRLRSELMHGKLAYDTARSLMIQIANYWGGAVAVATWRWREVIDPEPPMPREPVERMLAYLPPETRHPATADEWAAFREVRATATFADAGALLDALNLAPAEPPWHPAERALFEKTLADAEGPLDEFVIAEAGGLVLALGAPDDLPKFDRLEELAGTDSIAGPVIRNMRIAFRRRLGLPDSPAVESEPAPAGSADDGWDDDAG